MSRRPDPRNFLLPVLGAIVLIAAMSTSPAGSSPPFGDEEDVAFAADLWKALDGYEDWPMSSGVYPGTSPHGAFLRLHYSVVEVGGEHYHAIVKDNFGGEGASESAVADDPDEYRVAVTVMVQREAGYDPDNGDWYWVKYDPDGELATNARGMKLAGRVAKGSDQGCIACHGKAGGGDYLYTNDGH